MDHIEIISLQPENWKHYRDLRLRALQEDPQAFSSTYEENSKRSDAFWQERIKNTFIKDTQWLVFAKLNDNLVGMVGAFVEKEPDNAHVISVYVIPEERDRGIAKLLMKELLNKIKTNDIIKKITVDVNSEQKAALNLYKNFGFHVIKQYRMKLGDGKEHDLYQLQMLANEIL